jgi:two-component system NtrC family response regulator
VDKPRLLIVEDEASVAKQLKWSLQSDYRVTIAGDRKSAIKHLASGSFPVATLDLGLPPSPDSPQEGLKILESSAKSDKKTKLIVITGNDEKETALKAVSLGAADFCSKPIDLEVLKVILQRTFKMHVLEAANRQLRQEVDGGSGLFGMIGVSPVMQTIFSTIRKISSTDFAVLITGPSGSGKEMAAHAIHKLSPRASKPMIIVNCGAIPDNLIESELFGHEKGAFSFKIQKN